MKVIDLFEDELDGMSEEDKQQELYNRKQVTMNGDYIQHIKDPSIEVQLLAVKNSSTAIDDLLNRGFDITPNIQKALVTTHWSGLAILIGNDIIPSLRIQILAVSKYAGGITYIKKPHELVQQAAVKQYGPSIEFIIKNGITPSNKVQELAVQQKGESIFHILQAGIIPSLKLQLLAVQQNGYAIKYLLDAGIKLSKTVIWTGLTNENIMKRYNKQRYDDVVKQLFPTSSLLVNKWIRYGDRARAQIAKGNQNESN